MWFWEAEIQGDRARPLPLRHAGLDPASIPASLHGPRIESEVTKELAASAHRACPSTHTCPRSDPRRKYPATALGSLFVNVRRSRRFRLDAGDRKSTRLNSSH